MGEGNKVAETAGPAARHNEAASLVGRMTLEEKARLCSGRDFWHLDGCERLGIAPVMITDGPHGLRKQETAADHVGLNRSVPATCFPTACALAASWDPALLREVGVALGEQCAQEQVAVLLGPGMNIKRHPLCGRNFEYYSEDPLLTGELAAALIDGVQSQGVGTSVKHFAVNNQEHGRMYVNAIVDERTLREIYLRGFEIAITRARPWTVMCAYNRLNGEYCSEHHWLLNRVLRDEWGFRGLVMTDWGAASDRVAGIAAGLDLEMPSSGGVNDARILEAVRAGALDESVLDLAVVRNVSLSLAGGERSGERECLDPDAHHALARRVAAECTVLLKNDDELLPLSAGSTIAVIGAFAERPRYQGAGSSQVRPTRIEVALEALRARVRDPSQISYAPGYDPVTSEPDERLIQEAAEAAAAADVALVFAGLPASYESEAFDREHMRLPDQHDRLIEAVCAANANTVVVLSNGAPVEMPWVDRPRAVLEGYLAGQAGGPAVVDVLFGDVNPAGRLAETFPERRTDVAADAWFPGTGRQVQYREGLYVGYRYFDSAGLPVLYPFGHGLSYTSFEYGGLTVRGQGTRFEVAFDVRNSGEAAGVEVAQLYVHDVESSVYRPTQELKGFAKVRLDPGVTERVTLSLDDSAFSFFDREAGRWIVETGEFELRIGASSRDIRLTSRIHVEGDGAGNPGTGPELSAAGLETTNQAFADMLGHAVPAPEPVRPFHINSAVSEIAEVWLGRRLKARVVAGFKHSMGVGDAPPAVHRMFEAMANQMPLRGLVLFSRGRFGYRQLHVLVALLNHRYLEALRIAAGGRIEWG